MTNKSTKRALLSSVIAMLLCFSMLLGTTYAWFTDSVTSGNNIIKSGNLDIELEYWNGSSWVDVKDASDILTNELWEPGVTEVAYLRVANAGSLVLKYQLGINILNEIEGKNQANETFKLSDYIMFGVVEDVNGQTDAYTKDDAGRAEAIADVTDAKKISTGYTKASTMNPGDELYLALVVYMPTDIGNVANHNGTDVPQIDLGINVMATQMTAENDSFGKDYDENAPLLVWDGTVDTSWYDSAATTYELSTPADLAGLAKLVNESNTFAGKSIKLAADMDLNNIAWTPIGAANANFNGSFNGNGYTIYNLNVSGTKGVGLFGFAGNAAHIEGVRIVGANVTGVNSVGAVLGYGYLAENCLKYCVVEDAFVYATAGDSKEDGDKVGAVAGWTSNGNIVGNKAINCEVYGCRDMGGIVGYVNGENRAVEVSGNTVENVTVSVVEVEGYKKELGSNINDTVGRTGARVTVNSNSGTITKVEKVAVVSDSEELKNVVANGGQVLVTSGNYTFPGTKINRDTTLICAPDTVFEGSSGLNANGATIVGATFSNPTGSAGTSTVNGTYKNCTFDGSNGLRWCYAGETVVFENCVFTGDVYGIHFDGGANEAIFRNCTFSGFNAMGGAITKLTMEGCTFKANGRSGYNGINLWGSTDMKDCTFVFDGTTTEWVDARGDNKVYTFTNCVVTDGTTETPIEKVVGNYGEGNTIIVDGVNFAFDTDMFQTSIKNGATNITLTQNMTIVADDLKDASSNLTVDLAADTIVTVASGAAASKNLTFTGDKSSKVVLVNTNPGYEGKLSYQDNANLTFQGITFDANQISGICARGGVVTFVDCHITGELEKTIASKFVFSGCSFDVGVTQVGYGCSDVVFEKCNFETDGYGIKIYSEGQTPVNLTVKNCSFKNTGSEAKSAIFLDHIIDGISYNITVEGCTFEGFTAAPTPNENKWAARMIVADSFVKTTDGQHIFSYQTGVEGGSYHKILAAEQLVVTVK